MPKVMPLVHELQNRGVPIRRWPLVVSRIILLRLLARVTPQIVVSSNGMRLLLDTTDRVVAAWTFALGPFASTTVARALRLMSERGFGGIRDRKVLEVGANVGTETVSFVVQHGASSVIAIEPDPINADSLRINVALNKLQDRVTVLELAASSVDGSVTLELSATNFADHRVLADGVTPQSEQIIEVPARTLDSLPEIAPDEIALIWLDVQGHEGQVLDGASALLEAGIPIVTEYWPYGLERSHGRELLHRLIASWRIIDLSTPHPRETTVAALAKLPSSFFTSTDLLLLPAAQRN
jgi:FkbM family methyltransferase